MGEIGLGFVGSRFNPTCNTSTSEDVYDKEKFRADDHIAQLLRLIIGKVVFRQLGV